MRSLLEELSPTLQSSLVVWVQPPNDLCDNFESSCFFFSCDGLLAWCSCYGSIFPKALPLLLRVFGISSLRVGGCWLMALLLCNYYCITCGNNSCEFHGLQSFRCLSHNSHHSAKYSCSLYSSMIACPWFLIISHSCTTRLLNLSLSKSLLEYRKILSTEIANPLAKVAMASLSMSSTCL